MVHCIFQRQQPKYLVSYMPFCSVTLPVLHQDRECIFPSLNLGKLHGGLTKGVEHRWHGASSRLVLHWPGGFCSLPPGSQHRARSVTSLRLQCSGSLNHMESPWVMTGYVQKVREREKERESMRCRERWGVIIRHLEVSPLTLVTSADDAGSRDETLSQALFKSSTHKIMRKMD